MRNTEQEVMCDMCVQAVVRPKHQNMRFNLKNRWMEHVCYV